MPSLFARIVTAICLTLAVICPAAGLWAQALDGQVDTAFTPSLRAAGEATQVLLANDGRALLLGSFSHFNGQPSAGGVWLDETGGVVTMFNPQPPPGTTYHAVALFPDGAVLTLRRALAADRDGLQTTLLRLNGDGSIDPAFTAPNLPGYRGATVASNGQVLVQLTNDAGYTLTGPNGVVTGALFANPGPNGIVRLRADGRLDASFTPPTLVTERTDGLAILTSGKILLRGDYSAPDGAGGTILRQQVVRLLANGTLDPSFNLTGTLLEGGGLGSGDLRYGRLIAGPDESAYFLGIPAGVFRDRVPVVWRILSNGTLDQGFSVAVATPPAELIPLPSGGALAVIATLYFPGEGLPLSGLVKLNPDGSADPNALFPVGTLQSINAVARRPDGRIVAAGRFDRIQSLSRNSVAQFTAGFAPDASFDPGIGAEETGGWIEAIAALPDGRIWIGGNFTSINGQPRPRLARLLRDGSLDPAFAPNSLPRTIFAFVPDGRGGVIAASSSAVFAFDASGAVDAQFRPPSFPGFPNLRSLARQPDGKLLVGGDFEVVRADGGRTRSIARLLPDGSLDPGFDAGSGFAGSQSFTTDVLLGPNGRIYVGGGFESYRGDPAAALVALRPDGTIDPSFRPAMGNPPVSQPNRLALDRAGRVLFTDTLDTQYEYNTPAFRAFGGIRRFLPDGSADPTFQPAPRSFSAYLNYDFNALAVQPDGRIFVVGVFRAVGGFSAESVARLTSGGTVDRSFSAGLGAETTLIEPPPFDQPTNKVRAIAVAADGSILVGGYFKRFDGHLASGLVRLAAQPLPPAPASGRGRLINVSTRALVDAGENVAIGGFVIVGSGTRRIIVRAIGPSLTAAGVANALADPTVTLVNAAGVQVAANDDWASGPAGAALASVGLVPGDAREAALVLDLGAGAYTAIVGGKAGATGVALVEIYDLDPPGAARVVNLSTRALTDSPNGGSAEPTIGGFAIRGGPLKVVLRGLGPSLARAGVRNPLAGTSLFLQIAADGAELAYNRDFREIDPVLGFTLADLLATGLAPAEGSESAILVELPEGNYTGLLRGSGTPGIGLVEVYEVP